MLSKKNMNDMLSEIKNNVERIEKELREEYRKLIRFSSDFDEISVDFIALERRSLPKDEKDEVVNVLAERLSARLDATYGSDHDTVLIFEAAMDVMEETASAAVASRN